MSYFRYACIGLVTLVGGVAALWGALYGLGYLTATVASHFGINPSQLILSVFEGISDPGYVFVGLSFLLVLVATAALLLWCVLVPVVLGEVIKQYVLQNRLKRRR